MNVPEFYSGVIFLEKMSLILMNQTHIIRGENMKK